MDDAHWFAVDSGCEGQAKAGCEQRARSFEQFLLADVDHVAVANMARTSGKL